jgi:isoleucyl-tRNA synthetase
MRLNNVIRKAEAAYNEYEFHIIFHSIHDFCVNDLSAYYLDMSKDRLYCDGKGSGSRKSAQFAMDRVLQALIALMAPILSFTAEDIFKYYREQVKKNREESVFLLHMPKPDPSFDDEALAVKWEKLFEIREVVYRAIEESRKNKEISSSTEAKVIISAKGSDLDILISSISLLPMFLIVSDVEVKDGEPSVSIVKAPGEKCERCWQYKTTVGGNKEHSTLCKRCGDAVS